MSTTHPPESSVSGLSAAQVAERVSAGQTNEYRERTSRSAAQILRANVFTIFNGILGAALVLVLALGHWADALFGFVLVLNTATGTLAEIRAKRALDRLSVLETPRAIVVRDGAETEVAVGQVVLDDVVRLAAGQQVPADGEVLTSDGLEIDESILTGESRPVRPVSGVKVMSGTTVTAGTGLFRTTAVGGNAYAHRLAREARKYSLVVSELQAGTNRVLHWISLVIVPVALVLVWSQLRLSGSVGEAWSSGAWRHAVVAGIAGVVSMVPQGLVLLTSVNFATASLAASASVRSRGPTAVRLLPRCSRRSHFSVRWGRPMPPPTPSGTGSLIPSGSVHKDFKRRCRRPAPAAGPVWSQCPSPRAASGPRFATASAPPGCSAPPRSSWPDTTRQCWIVPVRSPRRGCASWPWPARARPGAWLRGRRSRGFPMILRPQGS